MMKKLICGLLTLCMLISFGGAAVAADADTSVSVAVSRNAAEAGEEITFTFVLNNPGKKAIEGVRFLVAASSGLTYESCTITDRFLMSDFHRNVFSAVIGGADPVTGETGEGVSDTEIELLTVTYAVAEGTPAGSILPVSVSEVQELFTVDQTRLTCDVSSASASVTVVTCTAGHTMDSGTVTEQPTCTEPGMRTYTCAVCGYTQMEEIPANGHTPAEAVRENESAATCTEDGGYDSVVYCAVCSDELTRTSVTVPAVGHDWGEWETVAPATEEQDGQRIRTCRNDSTHVETETIPQLAHQHVLTVVQETAAACTEDGMAAHWKCIGCGARFADENGETEVTAEALRIPAKGHVPGEPESEVTKEPTCTETGQKTTVTECIVCGTVCETTTEAIPPRGHVPGEPVIENVTPAVGTDPGHHEEVVYCTVCHAEMSRERVYEPVDAPVITVHPADVTALAGETAAFTVAADGAGLSWQWQESRDNGASWTDCQETGAQTAAMTFTATADHQGRTYRCLVSNPGGVVISSAAVLTVIGARITGQPKSVAVEEGERAAFTVKADGSDLSYQWQVSSDEGATWSDCGEAGSDTDTLSVLPRAEWSGWRYRCRVTGSGLTAFSHAATLTVTIPKNKPLFKTQNLVLSGQIGVNFFLDLSMLTEAERNASYMEFKLSGKGADTSTDRFDPNHMNASKKYYGFTCYVKSIQMADTITATFHYGDGKTVSRNYSVEEYFGVFDQHASENPKKTVDLIHAIADYGHYMQIYLANVNHFTIGTDYAESARHYTESYDYADILSKVEVHAIARAFGSSKVKKANYRLQLGSETTLDVFLTTSDGSAPTDVTLTVEEQVTGTMTTKAYTPVKQADGRYLITVPNISAHRLGDRISITGNADGRFTVDVSPLSFVRDVLKNETKTESLNGLSSLYAYYEAAITFKTA